jgi:hypothetical protein
MHEPVLQTVPRLHEVHAAPPRPQAAELLPGSHTPAAEQHPVVHVEGLHFGATGVQATKAAGNAATSTTRRSRRM